MVSTAFPSITSSPLLLLSLSTDCLFISNLMADHKRKHSDEGAAGPSLPTKRLKNGDATLTNGDDCEHKIPLLEKVWFIAKQLL